MTQSIIIESLRVEKFCEIAVNAEDSDDDATELLSEILLSSHESLDKLYECSHSNLNKLVEISKEEGIGARLVSYFKYFFNKQINSYYSDRGRMGRLYRCNSGFYNFM
jgi:hypothetical protein